MRVETPTPEGAVYVTVWNTSNVDVTLPSFSAVALASIKFKIHAAKVEGSDPSDPPLFFVQSRKDTIRLYTTQPRQPAQSNST